MISDTLSATDADGLSEVQAVLPAMRYTVTCIAHCGERSFHLLTEEHLSLASALEGSPALDLRGMLAHQQWAWDSVTLAPWPIREEPTP